MLLVGLLGLVTCQLVGSYVHNLERRDIVQCLLPDGTTRTVGEKFTIGESKCIKYECLQDGSAPYYYAGCQKSDNACVDIGMTYNDGCTLNTCIFESGKLFFQGDGCTDLEMGECKSEGDVWTVPRRNKDNPDYGICVTKFCEPGGYFNISKTECRFRDTCFGVGTFIRNEQSCEDIECMFDAFDQQYVMAPTKVCTAENGTHTWCVNVDTEEFPHIINNVVYKNCMCSRSGNGLSYQCFG